MMGIEHIILPRYPSPPHRRMENSAKEVKVVRCPTGLQSNLKAYATLLLVG